MLHLAHILNASFSPFQGAPQSVLDYHEAVDAIDALHGIPQTNVLEASMNFRAHSIRALHLFQLAIISTAKRLLSAMPCQRVLEAIWIGDIIYSPTSFIDLLPDLYKKKPITLYDPASAPLLNHHRLIVPRIRAGLEYCQFMVLFASYLMVVYSKHPLLKHASRPLIRFSYTSDATR